MNSSTCPVESDNPSCLLHKHTKNELWCAIGKIADSSQRNELRITSILQRQNLALVIAVANTILIGIGLVI